MPGTVAAGVFTQNRFCAAPVHRVPRASRSARRSVRALVVNAGNANAGTGDGGHRRCARRRAPPSRDCSTARRSEVLPFSTGVIMEPLPVDKIVGGAARAHARRSRPTAGSPRRRRS